MTAVGEYKKYLAVFYLKRRSHSKPWIQDPLLRHYRWYIAYYNTTESDVEDRILRGVIFGRKSRAFTKQVLTDGELELLLPSHSPDFYVEFARELGGEVRHYKRRVRLPGMRRRQSVQIPVIVFSGETQAHLHMLFSATVATFRNPSLYVKSVGGEILRRRSWSDWLGLGCADRFKEMRHSNYTSAGYRWVLRIGKAFRYLVGLSG